MKNAFIVGMILLNAFLLYALIRTGSAAKQRMIAGADTSVCAMEKWDIRESTLLSVRYAGRPFFISDSARALLAPYSAYSSKLFVLIQFKFRKEGKDLLLHCSHFPVIPIENLQTMPPG